MKRIDFPARVLSMQKWNENMRIAKKAAFSAQFHIFESNLLIWFFIIFGVRQGGEGWKGTEYR